MRVSSSPRRSLRSSPELLHVALLASALVGGSPGCGGRTGALDGPPTENEEAPPGGLARPARAPAASCPLGSNDPARPVLAFVEGDAVRFARADGSTFLAHTFEGATHLEGSALRGVALVSRADVLLALAWWSAGTQEVSEIALLDRSGARLWRRVEDRAMTPAFLGHGGVVALHGPSSGTTLVMRPDGGAAEHPGVVPVGGVLPSGHLPVHIVEGAQPVSSGWLDVDTGEIFGLSSSGTVALVDDAGSFVSLHAEGDTWFVTREAPGATVTVALPAEQPLLGHLTPFGRATVGDVDPSSQEPAPQWLVDFPSHTALEISYPAGLGPIGYQRYLPAALASDGSLLAALRDARVGGLFRSVDDGESWAPVGGTFRDITQLVLTQDRDGTFLIDASDEPIFAPAEPWGDPRDGEEADHVGPAQVVARPSDGVVRVLAPGARTPAIAPGGGCVALVDAAGSLHVFDVLSGQTTAAAGGGVVRAPTWIEESE